MSCLGAVECRVWVRLNVVCNDCAKYQYIAMKAFIEFLEEDGEIIIFNSFRHTPPKSL